jgi:hypothetical protein
MAKANVLTVRRGDAWATPEGAAPAEVLATDAGAVAVRGKTAMRERIETAASPVSAGAPEVASAVVVDLVAMRHHLDTVILKLATAQAGSFDAVKESRRHAEALLEMLVRADEVVCEHARFAGVNETSDGWECNGCGACWPKGVVATPALPLR